MFHDMLSPRAPLINVAVKGKKAQTVIPKSLPRGVK